ncbi:MAG: DUF433 domain-containing protein [Hormoscilla sp. SP5CHS1]|nr:DUF433 domain-containing protein [Hormoscilla sp. SP12CHS1]MBC6455262.1 DUF433 domain-containing protein [Hormoscilla sp. SP5CHS1]
MKLKELEPQLLALSDDEKAQVVQLLSQGKITLGRGIEKTPGVCGGSACIAGTRITVWGLVEASRLGYSEADLLTSYPSLSATDLANAWAYAESFPDEIETAIAENEDPEAAEDISPLEPRTL